MARIQCAGCSKVITEDDGKGPGATYGCCDECNAHTFRSKEHEAPETPTPKEAELAQQVEHWKQRAEASEAKLAEAAKPDLTPEETVQ